MDSATEDESVRVAPIVCVDDWTNQEDLLAKLSEDADTIEDSTLEELESVLRIDAPERASRESADEHGAEVAAGMEEAAAARLAESASRLTKELTKTQTTLRNALTATAIAAAEAPRSLSLEGATERLEQRLSDAVAATGTTVAILQTLDDDTQTLQIVAAFGLNPSSLLGRKRPLRGSRGDLEALVGRVVMADDLRGGGLDSYGAPEVENAEPMQSGICVSMQVGDLPIGTMWLLSEEQREFDHRDAASARLAAEAIATMLGGTQAIEDASPAAGRVDAIAELAEYQLLQMPRGASLTPQWRVDGMIETPQRFATGWHTWDVLPDGTLMMAMADIDTDEFRDALEASFGHAALISHCNYRHDVASMVRRISDTLWRGGTMVSPMSMWYVHVDPLTGCGTAASAGRIQTMIAGRYGYRAVSDGRDDPLGVHVDPTIRTHEFQIQSGETLFAYDEGVRRRGIDQLQLGRGLQSAAKQADSHPLARIRREISKLGTEKDPAAQAAIGAVSLIRSID